MRVKAAVARAYGAPLDLEGLELAEPGPTEMLVRLVACGVGRLDRAAIAGELGIPLPFVPGSEAAGIIERLGAEVTGFEPGDSVLVDYASCGDCEACRANHPRACARFAALNLAGRPADGPSPFEGATGAVNGAVFGQSAFATHLVCRAVSAVKLPSDAPLEIVAALSGDVLLGAAAVVENFRLRPGETLAVVGADAAGLAACQIAKDRGAAAIIVAEPDAARRQLASACGATITVHADEDLATAVRSLEAEGAHFAFETTGRPSARAACRDALRPAGRLGITDPAWRAEQAAHDVVDRAVLARALVLDLLDLYAEGRFPIDRLIGFFPFPKVNDALDALADGSVAKPVLRFGLETFGALDRAISAGAAREEPEHDPAPQETEATPAPLVVR